jgi:hypothetical protein
MRHLFAALLVLATLASPLRADIDPKQMPPDTTSVIRFDYARFAQSTVGKALLAKLPADTISEIKKVGGDFGFDPFKELTLTVIQGAEGRPDAEPEVSFLVTGLLDPARFVAELKNQGGERSPTETYQGGESEAGDYFMAAHTLTWPVIGLTLFATNISCVHLVSLAQSGYDTGLLSGNFEWMAAFTLILLGFFFAPFYLKSKVATLPDFLEKRYDRVGFPRQATSAEHAKTVPS